MKKLAILFILVSLRLINNATAQEKTSSKTMQFIITGSSIVKDSTGKVLPTKTWQQIMKLGGYALVPEDFHNPQTAFILRTPKQQQDLAFQHRALLAKTAGGIPTKRIVLNENSVVRDSAGMVYPYLAWKKLTASGEYYVQPVSFSPDSIQLVLKKRTEQQLDAIMANWKKPDESENFKIGSVFRPFKDKDINGEKIDLKLWAGKVVVLNFWFIGCPPCRDEIPDLNQLAERYKDNKDVIFVAVALDPSDDIKDYIKLHPFTYHIIDRGQYIAAKYGVRLYPTNVIINRDGKVAYSAVSSQSANRYWFKKTINEALATPVSTTAAK